MRKKFFIFLILSILLAFGYWTASPLFINKRVDEKLQTNSSPNSTDNLKLLYQGKFSGGAPGHSGEGTVKVIRSDKIYIRFEDDFKVTNGPDLYVYLAKSDKFDPNAQVAKLKGNQGSQNYELPDKLDIKNYSEVWIWCRAFSVLFAKSKLTEVTKLQ